jgi:hypothetical protein
VSFRARNGSLNNLAVIASNDEQFPDEEKHYYITESEIDTFRPVVRKIGEVAGYKEVEAFLEERRLEYANSGFEQRS